MDLDKQGQTDGVLKKNDIRYLNPEGEQRNVSEGAGSKRARIPATSPVGDTGLARVHRAKLKDGRSAVVFVEVIGDE